MSIEILERARKGDPPVNDTVFELNKYDTSLDDSLTGEALRERLLQISALGDIISILYNHYNYHVKMTKARKSRVYRLAYEALRDNEEYRKANAEAKAILIENVEVDYMGEKTSIVNEDFKIATYEYLAERGKDKLKLLYANLDLGRSMLSWDKSALENRI